MNQRRHKPYAPFIYYESSKKPEGIGSVSNKYDPSVKSGHYACISSRITAVIHITVGRRVDYNCFNEPFAVSPCKDLYWDMHGLIFETSIWLLAGSTRFLSWWLQNRKRKRKQFVASFKYGVTRKKLPKTEILKKLKSVLVSDETCNNCAG